MSSGSLIFLLYSRWNLYAQTASFPTEGPTHFKNNLGGNFLAKRTLAQAVHRRFFPQTLVPEGLNLPPTSFALIIGLLWYVSPSADIPKCRLSLTFWVVAVR